MAQKLRSKTLYVDINSNKGNFVSRIVGSKKSPDFSDIKLLRNLLTNEKSRILNTLKSKNPSSIYELAKILKRDIKSVRRDIKTLERFGLVDFILEKKGKRESLKPVLSLDQLKIELSL